jgi:hypothetical protein
MKNYDGLKASFEKAGLKLEIAKAPIQKTSNSEIFQLDIPRKTKGSIRYEYFRIYPGADDVLLAVQAVDAERKQLILSVRETEREFSTTTNISSRSAGRKEFVMPKVGDRQWGAKVTKVEHKGDNIVVTTTTKTPKSVRHYLCGVDERQLFICQLPKPCTSVDQAHAALKRPELILHEGKVPGRTIRQGEWFFLNLTDSEMTSLEDKLKKKLLVVHKDVPIEAGGHPHKAEELIRITGDEKSLRALNPKTGTGFPVREAATYVRGKITHEEHATVVMRQWRKVIRNNEAGTSRAIGAVGGRASSSPSGIYWVD